MKKRIKRILSILLAMVLSAGLFSAQILPTVRAADDISIDAAHFPDEIFREYVRSLDEDKNGYLDGAEREKVTAINCSISDIASLQGIEYFPALESLKCDYDQLTVLDLSKNTALTQLWCNNNQLTVLDLSKNTALTGLSCDNNELTALNLSKNTALTGLFCYNNQLTELDVSKNTALTKLYCYGNQLTALDLSKNTALKELRCERNQLTALDIHSNTALQVLACHSNEIMDLNISNNTFLEDTLLTGTNNSNEEYHDFSKSGDNGYSSLKFDFMTAVLLSDGSSYYENPYDMPSVPIDEEHFPDIIFREDIRRFVDKNENGYLEGVERGKITELFYDYSGISSLQGIEYFPALENLFCSANQLTELDLSQNTALENLYCAGNQLTALDLSKNTALTILNCRNNQLTELDLSQNTALTYLYCGGNRLTALDLSKNTVLTCLDCAQNQLTELDLSQITELTYLSCYKNQISELDISANPALEFALRNGEKDPWVTDYNAFLSYDEIYGNCSFEFDFLTAVRLSDGEIYTTPISEIFSDVKDSAYYAEAVLWAVRNGITTGTGDGRFRPKKTCTRAEIVTFLYAAAGRPEISSAENPFTDVKKKDWFYQAAVWAKEAGITGGTGDGKFQPNKVCTRAEVATFLYALAGRPEIESTENPFTDVKKKDYFYKAVLWAVENGITGGTGDGTTFEPKKSCTRGEIVTFLYKAVG